MTAWWRGRESIGEQTLNKEPHYVGRRFEHPLAREHLHGLDEAAQHLGGKVG